MHCIYRRVHTCSSNAMPSLSGIRIMTLYTHGWNINSIRRIWQHDHIWYCLCLQLVPRSKSQCHTRRVLMSLACPCSCCCARSKTAAEVTEPAVVISSSLPVVISSSLQKGVDHSKVEAVVPFKNVELKVRDDVGRRLSPWSCIPHDLLRRPNPCMAAPGADRIRLMPTSACWGQTDILNRSTLCCRSCVAA